MSNSKGWIGVDLDGTLAFYDHWRGIDHIGEPVLTMLDRVRKWVEEGKEVRIFTARVAPGFATRDEAEIEAATKAIRAWCFNHVGVHLPVTATKDFAMIELWDDRCVQVFPNSGTPVAEDLQRRLAEVEEARNHAIKAIDKIYRHNEACRAAVMEHWVRPTPSPS